MTWTGHADDSESAAAGLLARARGGDAAAAAQLRQAAVSWAPNHRNAAIDAANQLDPSTGDDLGHIKNPHKGILGGIGSILKVAAPIAGALIPGVGTLGALAIGGLGSAAGGALHGDKFNLGKTLAAGGAAAAGNNLLGNGLGGGGTNLGFGSHPNIPSGPGGIPSGSPNGAGNPTAPNGAAGPGALDRFGNVGSLIQKYGPMALGLLGTFQHAGEANKADQLRQQGVDMAVGDWQSRAPLRDAAMTRMLAPDRPRRDLSSVYADPTDPYARRN